MASFCAKKSVKYYSIFLSMFVLFSLCKTRAQTVPAMYVFGDSLVDVGNNNHLPLSLVKANLPHNGIDYPGKKATGRFSNGKNAADFLAEKLGLSTAPPYLSQPIDVFVKGVSFASGGAGIFNATDDNIIKSTIPLPHQVSYFSTVQQRLAKQLGPTAVQVHLAKSLFPIVIGSNDIIGFFDSGSEASKNSSPQQYIARMISTLKELLKAIYGLGGRKFLAIGVAPIGCAPKQRYRNITGECNTQVNYWSNKYNEGLKQMLYEVKNELNELHYSFFDTYSVFVDFIENPSTYGFNETKAACCGLGRLRAKIPCTPLSLYCPKRSDHLFWDIYHPTETAARHFIDSLTSGSGNHASPITLQQLIAI